MKINIKEVIIIILLSVFCGLIRYFLLDDDFSLIKKSKLSLADSQLDYQSQDSLLLFIENSNSPKLIDIDLAKKLYDSNLVTFIDARDSDSYLEKHILNALNVPYDFIEEVVEQNDLKYLIELNEDFEEQVYFDDNPLYFGYYDQRVYISDKELLGKNEDKSSSFVIYCSGEGCSLSEDLGFYMFDVLNIKKIFIYEGGMPEWLENNYPAK